MNSPATKLYVLGAALLMLLGSTACTFTTTTPSISVAGPVAAAPVVVHSAPTRVYHQGSWLYYRTDGYYYSRGTTWVRASSVPTHVVRYHSARPTHVVRSSPTHVVRSSPTHVRTTYRSAPVHTQRTVTNRRTYHRR